MLALTPQHPEWDFGLFFRPFKTEAWYAISVIFAMILVIIIGPYVLISYYEQTEAAKCVAFWSWFFFVLINAFYGGALTMFFTSEPKLPFSSIEDLMRAYPDWNLKMMDGNDVHFQYRALVEKDPLYSGEQIFICL